MVRQQGRLNDRWNERLFSFRPNRMCSSKTTTWIIYSVIGPAYWALPTRTWLQLRSIRRSVASFPVRILNCPATTTVVKSTKIKSFLRNGSAQSCKSNDTRTSPSHVDSHLIPVLSNCRAPSHQFPMTELIFYNYSR